MAAKIVFNKKMHIHKILPYFSGPLLPSVLRFPKSSSDPGFVISNIFLLDGYQNVCTNYLINELRIKGKVIWPRRIELVRTKSWCNRRNSVVSFGSYTCRHCIGRLHGLPRHEIGDITCCGLCLMRHCLPIKRHSWYHYSYKMWYIKRIYIFISDHTVSAFHMCSNI